MLQQVYKRLNPFAGSSYAQLDPQMLIVLNNIYDDKIKQDKFDSVKLNDSIYNNITINNI